MMRLALSFGLFVVTLLAFTPGCDKRHCSHGRCADDKDDDEQCDTRESGNSSSDEARTVCQQFCGRLSTCGSIAPGSEGACEAGCEASFDASPTRTSNGCSCVLRDACRPVSDYVCEGAPLPGGGASAGGQSAAGGASGAGASAGSAAGGTTSAGGTSTAGGTSSAGGAAGAVGYACETNLDCALGEDCVGSRCLPRCHASCECRKNESCVSGYCESDAPPPASCASDCECPSGQSCSAGLCQ